MTPFVTAIQNALGDRVRILRDPEGFPLMPARYGRVEWRGPEWNGTHRCYVYTDHRRLIPSLRRIPGLIPKQIGDTEAVFSFPAIDPVPLRAVADLLHPRQRRVLTPDERARLARTGFQPRVQGDITVQEGPE